MNYKFDGNKVFFTSDTHFYHANIINFCKRPFANVETMNEALIENWNAVVGVDDIVFHLGDFCFGGFANMLITVNTLPLVLEIGGIDKVGTFTGYYYTATFSAQIASPIVYGVVRMISGTYLSLFIYSPIMFILSILCILFVKHGEAIPQDIIDKVEEENAD